MDPEAVRLQASVSWQQGHSILPSSQEGQNPPQSVRDLGIQVVGCPSLTFSSVPLSSVQLVSSPSGRGWEPGKSSAAGLPLLCSLPRNSRKRQVLGFHCNAFHMENSWSLPNAYHPLLHFLSLITGLFPCEIAGQHY